MYTSFEARCIPRYPPQVTHVHDLCLEILSRVNLHARRNPHVPYPLTSPYKRSESFPHARGVDESRRADHPSDKLRGSAHLHPTATSRARSFFGASPTPAQQTGVERGLGAVKARTSPSVPPTMLRSVAHPLVTSPKGPQSAVH